MNQNNNRIPVLRQYIKHLYTTSGHVNLYIRLCHKENAPDTERLKLEISKIKKIVMNIENEINNL